MEESRLVYQLAQRNLSVYTWRCRGGVKGIPLYSYSHGKFVKCEGRVGAHDVHVK